MSRFVPVVVLLAAVALFVLGQPEPPIPGFFSEQ
jgi:hypothetical protein